MTARAAMTVRLAVLIVTGRAVMTAVIARPAVLIVTARAAMIVTAPLIHAQMRSADQTM
jgi:hypothetical protein